MHVRWQTGHTPARPAITQTWRAAASPVAGEGGMSDMVRFCVCSAGGKRTALASRERAILSPISHGNAVHTVLSPGDLGGGHD